MTKPMCPCGKGDQHSLSESATCDWMKNHKGKDTDKRTPKG